MLCFYYFSFGYLFFLNKIFEIYNILVVRLCYIEIYFIIIVVIIECWVNIVIVKCVLYIYRMDDVDNFEKSVNEENGEVLED